MSINLDFVTQDNNINLPILTFAHLAKISLIYKQIENIMQEEKIEKDEDQIQQKQSNIKSNERQTIPNLSMQKIDLQQHVGTQINKDKPIQETKQQYQSFQKLRKQKFGQKQLNTARHDQQTFYMFGVGMGNSQLIGYHGKIGLLYDSGSSSTCIHPKLRQTFSQWTQQVNWTKLFTTKKNNIHEQITEQQYNLRVSLQNITPPDDQQIPISVNKRERILINNLIKNKGQTQRVTNLIHKTINNMKLKHLFIVLSHPDKDHINYIQLDKRIRTIPENNDITVFLEGQWLDSSTQQTRDVLTFLFDRTTSKTHIQFAHYWGGINNSIDITIKHDQIVNKFRQRYISKNNELKEIYIQNRRKNIIKKTQDKEKQFQRKYIWEQFQYLSITKFGYKINPVQFSRAQSLLDYYNQRIIKYTENNKLLQQEYTNLKVFSKQLNQIKIVHSCFYRNQFNNLQRLSDNKKKRDKQNLQSAVVEAIAPKLKMHIFLTGDAGFPTLNKIWQNKFFYNLNEKWTPLNGYLSFVMIPHHGSPTTYVHFERGSNKINSDNSNILFQLFKPDMFGISAALGYHQTPSKYLIQTLNHQCTESVSQIGKIVRSTLFYDRYQCTKQVNSFIYFDPKPQKQRNQQNVRNQRNLQMLPTNQLPSQNQFNNQPIDQQQNQQQEDQSEGDQQQKDPNYLPNPQILQNQRKQKRRGYLYPSRLWLQKKRKCNEVIGRQVTHHYCRQMGLPLMCTNILGTIKIDSDAIHCPFSFFVKTQPKKQYCMNFGDSQDMDEDRNLSYKNQGNFKPKSSKNATSSLNSQLFIPIRTNQTTANCLFYITPENDEIIINKIFVDNSQQPQWYIGHHIQRNIGQQDKYYYLDQMQEQQKQLIINPMLQKAAAQKQRNKNIKFFQKEYKDDGISPQKIQNAFSKLKLLSFQKQQKEPNLKVSYTFDIRKTGIKTLDVTQLLSKTEWIYASSINLSHNQIGNKGWKAIIQNSQAIANIQSLHLLNNQITTIKERDLDNLSKTSLKFLDLRKNRLSKSSIKIISKYIKQNPQFEIVIDDSKAKDQTNEFEKLQLQITQKSKLYHFQEPIIQEPNQKEEEAEKQQEIIDQNILKQHLSNRQYIDGYFKLSSSSSLYLIYRQNRVEQWRRQSRQNMILTKNGYQLVINQLNFVLEDLINNIKWDHIQTLIIDKCKLQNKHWQILLQNSDSLKNIKVLMLGNNLIENIHEGQLQLFASLRKFWLHKNPLDQSSKQVLKKYKQKFGDQYIQF